MSRNRWIYKADGRVIDCSVEQVEDPDSPSYPTFIPDLPDFVSPIDGKVYSGRAGMREHCRKHDVVPQAELAGLPHRRPDQTSSKAYREETKRVIADVINSRYHS
jgi:hypothetical protein